MYRSARTQQPSVLIYDCYPSTDPLVAVLTCYFIVVAFVLTVCMGSTYEDDCEEGDEIILCDGCNAEAHMK
jgi:hypothetical protein